MWDAFFDLARGHEFDLEKVCQVLFLSADQVKMIFRQNGMDDGLFPPSTVNKALEIAGYAIMCGFCKRLLSDLDVRVVVPVMEHDETEAARTFGNVNVVDFSHDEPLKGILLSQALCWIWSSGEWSRL